MKKILLLMLTISLVSFASAQSQSREEQKLLTTLYYEFNKVQTTSRELAKLDAVIEILKSDTSIKVEIEGYCDHFGGETINERISQSRAARVADYLLKHNIAESQITFKGRGIDTEAESNAKARRVDVSQIVIVVIEPTQELEEQESNLTHSLQEAEDARAAEPTEDIDTQMQVEPESSPESKRAIEGFSLRTNLLYWLTGNMNIGVEYRKPGSDLCFIVNGGYSLFGETEWCYNIGGWFVTPEVRYYLPHNEQWFVGVQFLAAGYNYKLSKTGYQGSVLAGGVMGGYCLTLSDTFDMDFTLGFGYGHYNYDTYYHYEPTETNPYIEKGVSKNSIVPIQAGVNLIWKIN